MDKGRQVGDELLEKIQLSDWVFHSEILGIKAFFRKSPPNTCIKLSGYLPSDPERILTELFDNFEETEVWNEDISVSRILKKIDENTDIVYKKTTKLGYNIKPREFVILRHCRDLANDGKLLGFASQNWGTIPVKNENVVRGHYESSGWMIKSFENDKNNLKKSEFQLVLDMNLHLCQFPLLNMFPFGLDPQTQAIKVARNVVKCLETQLQTCWTTSC